MIAFSGEELSVKKEKHREVDAVFTGECCETKEESVRFFDKAYDILTGIDACLSAAEKASHSIYDKFVEPYPCDKKEEADTVDPQSNARRLEVKLKNVHNRLSSLASTLEESDRAI